MERFLHIRAANGRYLQAERGGGGAVAAIGPWPREWETLSLITDEPWDAPRDLPRTGVPVRVGVWNDGSVLVVSGSTVTATGTFTTPDTEFTLSCLDDGVLDHLGRFALRARDGRYLAADSATGQLVFKAAAIGPEETFTAEYHPVPTERTRSDPALHNKWICTGQAVIESGPDGMPTYRGEKGLAVRCQFGFWQAASGGGGEVSVLGPWAREWETFTIVAADPASAGFTDHARVNLVTWAGFYLTARDPDGVLAADGRGPGVRETFQVELVSSPQPGHVAVGTVFGLRAANGKLVSASPDGLRADAAARGSRQTFTIEESGVLRAVELVPTRAQRRFGLYAREEITFAEADTALTDRLRTFTTAEGLAAGDTLVIAARRLIGPGVGKEWRFINGGEPVDPPTRIVIVAGEFVGGGTLNFGGQDGLGRHARHVEVFAGRAGDLRVLAKGGTGTDGVDGRDGADLEQCPDEWDPESRSWLWSAFPPTAGADGTNGKTGGNGGAVRMFWVSGNATAAAPPGAGGRAGVGGRGGKGGKAKFGSNKRPRFRQYPDMPDGKDGIAGAAGRAGPVQLTQVTPEELWARARDATASTATAAADHLANLADYRFRQVTGLPTEAQLTRILDLLRLSTQLVPGHIRAVDYRDRILNGRNALGRPRYEDLVPSVDYWRDEYQSMLSDTGGLFSFLLDVLEDLRVAKLNSLSIQAQVDHIEGSRKALELELANAEIGRANAVDDQDYAAVQWKVIEDEIRQRRNALENAEANWGGLITMTFATVVGIVIDVQTKGVAGPWVKTVLSVLPDVLALTDASFAGSEKEAELCGKALTGADEIVRQAYGAKDLAAKKGPDGSVDIGKAVRESGVILLSFAKLIKDLNEAQGDPELLALTKELAAQAHRKLLADRAVAQANRTMELARHRLDAANDDLERYKDLAGLAGQDAGKLRECVLMLLTAVRRYTDAALLYKFKAARALEIYALEDTSNRQGLCYRRVNPDDELDFRDGFLAPLDLRERLMLSDIAGVEDMTAVSLRFNTVMESGWDINNVVFIDITTPGELAQFRATRSLTVPVHLDEIDSDHYGARVWGVLVTLEGATAQQPIFSIGVTHLGVSQQRWWDNHVKTVVSQPHLAASQRNAFIFPPSPQATQLVATLTREGGDQPNRKLPTGFWGRGVATTWSLHISSFEYTKKGVDLTNLTRIKVALFYERCLAEPGTTVP